MRPHALALLALWLSFALWLAPWAAHADPSESPCSCGQAAAASAPAAANAPLDLNTASEAELLGLPSVGLSRARAIIAFRDANHGFTSVSQLMRIKGFGRAMLKRLRPLVTVSPPAASRPGADPLR